MFAEYSVWVWRCKVAQVVSPWFWALKIMNNNSNEHLNYNISDELMILDAASSEIYFWHALKYVNELLCLSVLIYPKIKSR